MKFKQFLNERYLNFVGNDPKKQEYAQQVFDMLQKSYESIGGIKGNGFGSPEEMIRKIPFWKLVRRNGKIVAGALYKDKGGRKRVAVFTDGSEAGKKEIGAIYKQEFGRAYFEVSDGALGFIVKLVGIDFVKKYAKTPEQAAKIMGDSFPDEINPDIPDSDPHIKRLPQLKGYFYQRDLGGKMKTKIMLGTTGKTVQQFTA